MEVGNKDVYEYISYFADDKTVINMILANPKVFDNEKFYEKVMRRRYPLLIEFRKENETWKALYLRMVYVLAILQEKYQIPYIPTKGCNPENLLTIFHKENIYSEALICAAMGDNIPLIDYFFKKGSRLDLSRALGTAGQYSNLETVKYLISKGANDYEILWGGAASGGKVDIIKFALDNLRNEGLIDINNSAGNFAITIAIDKEYIDIIDFLIKNGFVVREKHIEYAERKGKYNIAAYLRKFL